MLKGRNIYANKEEEKEEEQNQEWPTFLDAETILLDLL